MDNLTSLRDRIAAALRNLSGPEASGHPITYEGMADAVIDTLGLHQEYAYARHPRRRGADYRYVTAWTNDE